MSGYTPSRALASSDAVSHEQPVGGWPKTVNTPAKRAAILRMWSGDRVKCLTALLTAYEPHGPRNLTHLEPAYTLTQDGALVGIPFTPAMVVKQFEFAELLKACGLNWNTVICKYW